MQHSTNAKLTIATAILFAGCSSDPHLALEPDAPVLAADDATSGAITAELVVATAAALPRCTTTLGGTTAYVQQGQALYTCARNSWTRQTCTVDRAGEVAFVTGESFLLACSAKNWNQVALPQGAAGPTGPAGETSLVATNPEPAGASCASGGIAVTTGRDTNSNNLLDTSEVTATSYVCNGGNGAAGSGAAPIRTATRAATSGECGGGGQIITIYQDANTNSAQDPGESLGDPIQVCNGDPVAANGSNPVVKSYQDAANGDTAAEGGTVTVLDGTISTPRAGTVIAIGSSLAFCAAPGIGAYAGQGYDCDTATLGDTFANLTVVQSGVGGQAGNSGEAIIAGLTPDVDSPMNVTAVFNLAAGTYTFALRGMMTDNSPAVAAGKGIYFGASELLLLFVPND